MELAALVRSVFKLSAGVQLAPLLISGTRSSLLCQLAGEHTVLLFHDRHFQKEKTCEKHLWFLNSFFQRDVFDENKSKGGEPAYTERKGKRGGKKKKPSFSSLLSQGHLGHLGKVYSTCFPKHFLSRGCCMLRMVLHSFGCADVKRQSRKENRKCSDRKSDGGCRGKFECSFGYRMIQQHNLVELIMLSKLFNLIVGVAPNNHLMSLFKSFSFYDRSLSLFQLCKLWAKTKNKKKLWNSEMF